MQTIMGGTWRANKGPFLLKDKAYKEKVTSVIKILFIDIIFLAKAKILDIVLIK